MKVIVARASLLLALTLLACCGGGRTATPQNPATSPGNVATDVERPPGASTPGPPASEEADLPAGTRIAVRLGRALSTARDRKGDAFDARLDEPVVVGGVAVLPKETTFTGHVTTSAASGRLKGRGVLRITLDAFDLNGRHYPIESSLDTSATAGHKKRNVEFIGGGAGLGALIGGLTGGGKGAGIGAAVGAAAGTGVAAATGTKNVDVPAGTVFRFVLRVPVTVQR